MLLGLPPKVAHNEGERSQYHVGYEGKSEEDAGTVGCSGEKKGQGEDV